MNETMRGPQERLLAQLARIPVCQTAIDGADWFPPVDIVEDAEEYLFKIDLPGVKPEDVQVATGEEELAIFGERANPWQGERKPLRVERPYGSFVRRFALPEDANVREVSTLFTESVLEVHVRKVSVAVRVPTPTDARSKLRLRPAA